MHQHEIAGMCVAHKADLQPQPPEVGAIKTDTVHKSRVCTGSLPLLLEAHVFGSIFLFSLDQGRDLGSYDWVAPVEWA
jgi:hypothetical protein